MLLILAQWPQFGGPTRDFQVADAPLLAALWPPDGPKNLWARDLGPGFSGIAVSNGRMFTMYNRGSHGSSGLEEVITALDQATGKTIWEYGYRAMFKVDADVGPGPHATPLVDGDRVYTTGRDRQAALPGRENRQKVVWMRDLKIEYNGSPLIYGYASSPLLYKDKIIVPAGGNDYALMAFALVDRPLARRHQALYPRQEINRNLRPEITVLRARGLHVRFDRLLYSRSRIHQVLRVHYGRK